MTARNLTLCAILAMCLALTRPAWAGTIEFTGTDVNGQGAMNFDPGAVGNLLTIGAGGGGNGALITDLVNTLGICGGDCIITGGYMTVSSGGYLGGGSCSGGICSYSFGGGGTLDIMGGIASKGIANGSTLLTATFNNGTLLITGSVGTFAGALNLASIALNSALGTYNYIGASGDAITISLNGNCSSGGVCSGLVDQASVSLQTIPEPATLSVLGVGLFVFGAGLRRKLLPY